MKTVSKSPLKTASLFSLLCIQLTAFTASMAGILLWVISLKNLPKRDFPGGQLVKTALPLMKGAQVQSLGGELRSQMPCNVARKLRNSLKNLGNTIYSHCFNYYLFFFFSSLSLPKISSELVISNHLQPDILECEVKWALGSNTMNKAIGGDGIPVELFQILKDAIKVLHSVCQLV